MCESVEVRTPLCSARAIFGDLPAEHSVYFLDQLWAEFFDAAADLCKHQLTLQVSTSFLKVGNTSKGVLGDNAAGMKGEEVSRVFLYLVIFSCSGCHSIMQVHVGTSKNHVPCLFYLDLKKKVLMGQETTQWKDKAASLNTHLTLDVNSVAFLPHFCLQALAWHYWLGKAHLRKYSGQVKTSAYSDFFSIVEGLSRD